MLPSDKTRSSLEPLFNPRSVAIVGASSNPGKPGYSYLKQLIEFGFKGEIYPIHPREVRIIGRQAYPSLEAIPGPVDYVISAIVAELVPILIAECRRKGVKIIQLYTAQLAETGVPERERLEEKIVSLAHEAGIRLLGPNCMGIYSPQTGMTFRTSASREEGEVALVAQSASNAAQVMQRGWPWGLNFSSVISYGNAADIDESELIDYLAHDPKTKVITAYIEGVRNPHFHEILERTTRRKPVVIFKAGRTETGVRSAASHTGSIAGRYDVWKSLMRQCRAVNVESLEELIDVAIALSKLPKPFGFDLGVIGAAGGGSIIAADEFELNGFKMPPIPAEIVTWTRKSFNIDYMTVRNPLDTSALLVTGWEYDNVSKLLQRVAEHPVFQILVADIGEWVPDALEDLAPYEGFVNMFIEIKKSLKKPMALILRSADHADEWKWRGIIAAQKLCNQNGIAIFPTIARAAKALRKWADYYQMERGL